MRAFISSVSIRTTLIASRKERWPNGSSGLEKVRSDWIVCFFHHPPYTKGSHDSDTEEQLIEMRQHIMPILEEVASIWCSQDIRTSTSGRC